MKQRVRAGSQETLPAATEATTKCSGKELVASHVSINLKLSSLDALDLPKEIEGFFVLARYARNTKCFVEKRNL